PITVHKFHIKGNNKTQRKCKAYKKIVLKMQLSAPEHDPRDPHLYIQQIRIPVNFNARRVEHITRDGKISIPQRKILHKKCTKYEGSNHRPLVQSLMILKQ